MAKILVLDGYGRHSLGVVRSLGKKGHEILCGEEDITAMCFYSKYCKKHIIYPSPKKYPEKFKNFLLDCLKKEKIDFLIPTLDHTTEIICLNKEEFLKYTKIFMPDYEDFIKARDKSKTIIEAEKTGVAVPKSVHIKKSCEYKKGSLNFPVVIKPDKSCGSKGLSLVEDEKDIVKRLESTIKNHGPVVVQEYIPPGGDAVGASCLFDSDSNLVAVFSHKRLREFPWYGGPSTLREAVNAPEIEEKAVSLLKHLNWKGVAMVEFKTHPKTKKPYIMEINPRFWGSIHLAIKAGVDFPYLFYKTSLGEKIEKPLQNIGYKCRWLWGDIMFLLSAPFRLKNIKEWFNFKNQGFDDFEKGDIKPFFGFLLCCLKNIFRKEMRSFAFKKNPGMARIHKRMMLEYLKKMKKNEKSNDKG